MKKSLHISYILLFFLYGCANHKSLYDKKPAFYSYIVGDVNSDHIYKEHFSEIYATPASCQKIITALLGLKSLGVNYRYNTNLYATKKSNKIHDVIIEFTGDPTLTSENLMNLLVEIKNTNINGKIILDISHFQIPTHSQNLMIDDLGKSYAQPISAASIDKNSIKIDIISNIIDNSAKASNDCGYEIDSKIILNSNESNIEISWDEDKIKVKGNLNPENLLPNFYISPKKLEPYLLYKIQRILKNLNIKADIVIIKDKTKLPNNLVLLKTKKSELLKNIINSALKESDNFIFDNLYVKIANFHNESAINNWVDGDKIIKKLIKEYFNINLDKSLFVDGSGLSRYNRIQPKKLFEILKKGYANKEFVDALAVPGEKSSTLQKRNLHIEIRAKTGTMSGISCLCGYNVNQKNPKAFVMIVNSYAPPLKDITDIIDNFISKSLK